MLRSYVVAARAEFGLLPGRMGRYDRGMRSPEALGPFGGAFHRRLSTFRCGWRPDSCSCSPAKEPAAGLCADLGSAVRGSTRKLRAFLRGPLGMLFGLPLLTVQMPTTWEGQSAGPVQWASEMAVSRHLCHPSYRALTFTLAGLSPAEHTSLRWTHRPRLGSRETCVG